MEALQVKWNEVLAHTGDLLLAHIKDPISPWMTKLCLDNYQTVVEDGLFFTIPAMQTEEVLTALEMKYEFFDRLRLLYEASDEMTSDDFLHQSTKLLLEAVERL